MNKQIMYLDEVLGNRNEVDYFRDWLFDNDISCQRQLVTEELKQLLRLYKSNPNMNKRRGTK